jgi:hypothetical protein
LSNPSARAHVFRRRAEHRDPIVLVPGGADGRAVAGVEAVARRDRVRSASWVILTAVVRQTREASATLTVPRH